MRLDPHGELPVEKPVTTDPLRELVEHLYACTAAIRAYGPDRQHIIDLAERYAEWAAAVEGAIASQDMLRLIQEHHDAAIAKEGKAR